MPAFCAVVAAAAQRPPSAARLTKPLDQRTIDLIAFLSGLVVN
jgi:hypothetical protein